MKLQYLALPFVALLPAGALAQTTALPAAPKKPLNATMAPEAAELLARAKATYKDVSGISFSVSTTVNGKEAGTANVRFSRPNMLSVEQGIGKNTQRLLLSDKDFYIVQGTSYRKQEAPPVGAPGIMESIGGASGSIISALLEGKDPIAAMQSVYASAPFQGFQGRTVAVAPQLIDGDVYSGVQSTFSFKVPARDGSVRSFGNQMTAWFGGSPLALRRVQSRFTQDGKTTVLSEKIFNQELSPSFAADTFKFNDTGLKPVSDEGGDDGKYFDARLVKGAEPFAFEAKGLDGATLTPSKYKGKVLLLDFWATWCGPCVASLPELKGAYDKYHAQGLEVVGISLDEDKKALTSFIKTNKMAWPQVFDGKGWNSRVPGIYGVKAIPFMLIIGKDGKIAAVNPRGNIDAAVKAALAAS